LKKKLFVSGKIVHLRAALRKMDTNNKGFLSPFEFKEALLTLGATLRSREMASLIALLDTGGDGRIIYEEFLSKMSTTADERSRKLRSPVSRRISPTRSPTRGRSGSPPRSRDRESHSDRQQRQQRRRRQKAVEAAIKRTDPSKRGRIHHRKGSLLGMHGQALSSAPGQAAAGLAKGRGEREHHGGAHNIQHRDAHGNIIGEYGSSTWTMEERIERGLIDNRSYLQKSRDAASLDVQAMAASGRRWNPALLASLLGEDVEEGEDGAAAADATTAVATTTTTTSSSSSSSSPAAAAAASSSSSTPPPPPTQARRTPRSSSRARSSGGGEHEEEERPPQRHYRQGQSDRPAVSPTSVYHSCSIVLLLLLLPAPPPTPASSTLLLLLVTSTTIRRLQGIRP